jgi:hypothetical protein
LVKYDELHKLANPDASQSTWRSNNTRKVSKGGKRESTKVFIDRLCAKLHKEWEDEEEDSEEEEEWQSDIDFVTESEGNEDSEE